MKFRKPLIAIAILVALFITAQAFMSASLGDTEQYKYAVIKEYPDFEIRRYEPAVFSTVLLDAESYKETSGNGFRTLAGYIFGGNEREESIAMTSPVVMEFGDKSKMKFMVPSGYAMDSLPKPNNKNIRFESEGSKIMAAVRFGGWASDEKIKEHENKLSAALEAEGIEYNGNFSFLGYNPPYEVTNRRNEVVTELINYEEK
jgi:hypothetical protein